MERASGVYRRNARGIAILIGFLFAIATNSDTFYMVSRLSKDTLLRSTISQAADQAIVSTSVARSPTSNTSTSGTIQADLESVKTAVDDVLDELPLPVGWNRTVVDEQVQDEKKGALLNKGMNCPHPQPFSPRRREPDLLFPLPEGEG